MVRWIIFINKAECKFLFRYFVVTTSHNVRHLKNVIDVLSFDDSDNTVLNGIKLAIKKYPNYKIFFANGGDRNSKTTPEIDFCITNNIETLWEIGGSKKSNSSSWILNKWQQKK